MSECEMPDEHKRRMKRIVEELADILRKADEEEDEEEEESE